MHDPLPAPGIVALVVHDLPERPPERLRAGHGGIGVQIYGAVAAVGRGEREEVGDEVPGEAATAVRGADVDAAQLCGLAGG